MIRPALLAAVAWLAAGAAQAQMPGVLDRLRDLAPDTVPGASDIYADEIAADLARITAAAPMLFDPARPGPGPAGAPVAIAVFVAPDCQDCAAALRDLAAIADRQGLRAAVLNVSSDPDLSLLFQGLGLDILPSYVMPDRMIRGAMPGFVLERYLGG